MPTEREEQIEQNLVTLMTECQTEGLDFQEIMLRATERFDPDV